MSWERLFSDSSYEELFHSSLRPIKQYLWLARNTESPKQFHLWSLLSITSALASNFCHLNHGVGGRLLLNLGVVLTGRAATRKSSAISFVQRFTDDLFQNYGPTDTGGARHGIMAAMQNRWQDDRMSRDEDMKVDSLEELSQQSFDEIVAKVQSRKTRTASLYFCSKELGRLLTAQTRELLDFFADGVDGEPIYYQTKSGSIRIPRPIIGLLGATTPGSLSHILPRDSHDHGLLSRLIFVYAPNVKASVPIPPSFTDSENHIRGQLLEQLTRLTMDAKGEIGFDDGALDEYKSLYDYAVPTSEFKLNAYSGRRAIHLAKLAGVICLLRGESPYQVNRQDIALAHVILALTESMMDGAYVGLDKSKDARAYTVIREVVESMPNHGVSRDTLYGHLSRSGLADDEITAAFERLHRARRIRAVGSAIALEESIVGEKMWLYLNGLKERV